MGKQWRIALVAALAIALIAGSLVAAHLLQQTGENVLEQLAEAMARQPDAATAAKIVDAAVAADDANVLFQALAEHLAGHLGIRGVEEEYLRGFNAYLEMTLDLRAIELADPLFHHNPAANVKTPLAQAYLVHASRDWRTALEVGGQMLERGWLTEEGLGMYCQAHFGFIVNLPFPGASELEADVLNLLARGYAWLEQEQSYRADRSLLGTWLTLAGGGDADYSQLAGQLDLLSREEYNSELALTVYWQTRVMALLIPLEPGWQHPLGWNVAEELIPLYQRLTSQWQKQVSQMLLELHQTVDQALLLYDMGITDLEQALRLRDTMLTGLGLSSEVALGTLPSPDKPETAQMDIPATLWQPRGREAAAALADMAKRWPESEALQPAGSLASLVKGQESSGLTRSRQTVLFFDLTYYRERPGLGRPAVASPGAPALAIPDSRGGITLFNIETWRETRVSGEMAAWSPAGDQLAVVSNREGKYRILILNADGTPKADFIIGRDYQQFDWLLWYTPDLLVIERATGSNEVEQTVISVSGRSLTERRPGQLMTRIAGSQFLTDGKLLYNLNGETLGTGLNIYPDASHGATVIEIPQLDAQIYYSNNRLIYRDSDGWEKDVHIGDNVEQWLAGESNRWAVLYQGKIYIGGFRHVLEFDAASGNSRFILPPWQPESEAAVASPYPFYFWTAEEITLPLVALKPDEGILTGHVFKLGQRHVLAIHPLYSGQTTENIPLIITEFR